MKIAKMAMTVLMVLMATAAYAYIPANDEENTYQERVEGPFLEATDLVNDGIKAIRQNVVSSTYENQRGTALGNGGLAESEKGKEEVTSKDILYYEPKEEIYEAKETMEEVLIWLTMYKTTAGEDVVTYTKLKEFVTLKLKLIEKLINALKTEKDNKDSVINYKMKIKKADKDYKRFKKQMKGKLLLIEGKPLPEPKNAQ